MSARRAPTRPDRARRGGPRRASPSGRSATSPATARSRELLDGRRRLGDHDQRARRDLRQAPHRGRAGYHDEVFHDDDHVVRTLTKLLDDASTAHRKLDPTEGLQDAQLDDGARLHIVHGDISRGGHLMVNIRKFTGVRVPRASTSSSTRDMLDAGRRRVPRRRACAPGLSIVFAGAPGSGKTTLLSCCAAELDPALRVVIAEEVFEADVPAGQRRQHADPARPRRPARGRPAPARRRLPPHGPRRRDRRRGPRPGGAAAAADPVLGGDRASPRSTPAPPARHSPGCASSASSPTRSELPLAALNTPGERGRRPRRPRRARARSARG